MLAILFLRRVAIMEKAPYYIFKRKLKSGKSVYYWYRYDKYGKRTVPESTGCTRRNEAILFCNKRMLQGGRIGTAVTFKDFSEGWFTDSHFWLIQKRQTHPVKEATLHLRKIALKVYIVPFFKTIPLEMIDEDLIFSFRNSLIEKELSGNYINSILSTLKIMLDSAVDKGFLQKNPIPSTFGSMRQERRREAFTVDELIYIFGKKWQYSEIKYFCMLSAITGMRFSEVRGLQKEQLFDNYIEIDRQFYFDKLAATKTGEKRFAPVPERFIKILRNIPNHTFFMFPSLKTIDKPIYERTVRQALYRSYSDEMRNSKDNKCLTFHSFRHFFNTYLLSNDIKKEKVDFIMGHSAGRGSMTELYTSWKPEMYNDVLKLQEELLDKLIGD